MSGRDEAIVACVQHEGEGDVSGHSQALILQSLVRGCVVSHSLRRARPVPERAPLRRVRIVHQAIHFPPCMGFQAFLAENLLCAMQPLTLFTDFSEYSFSASIDAHFQLVPHAGEQLGMQNLSDDF